MTIKSYFNSDSKLWRIQVWKGNYLNMGVGAEIGIYYQAVAGQYSAADKDMRYMTFKLYQGTPANKRMLFRREGTHWWLTGFRPGIGTINSGDLSMEITINLANNSMAKAFYNGLIGNSGMTKLNEPAGDQVRFTWQ